MKHWMAWLLIVLAIAAAACAGYWFGHRGAPTDAADTTGASGNADAVPVATVSVVPIRQAAISEQITAYGTVIAPLNRVRVLSVPFEARVAKMLVTPGEVVAANQPLIEVESSSATQLALQEAQNAAAAADRDLKLVQQRFGQKLATNAEFFTAQSVQKAARNRLQNLQQGGAGGPRQVKTDAAGIVSKVDVQIGQVVPIGGPLVEVAAQNQIAVRLGVNPEDVPYLKTGQAVLLQRIDDPAAPPVHGTIRLVGQRVDPATHLVDVMVKPASASKLLLEDFVAGHMTKVAAEGLIVPRQAVLPGDAGDFVLYTVRDGKAVKHVVRVGVENDHEAQVIGGDLQSGEPVVVVGNYELEDGMAVKVLHRAPAAQPAHEEGLERVETRPVDRAATQVVGGQGGPS